MWQPEGGVAQAHAIAVASDGPAWVGGSVQAGRRNDAGETVEFLLLRLDDEGRSSGAWQLGVEGYVQHVAVLSDGGVVVAGRCNPGSPCAHDIVTMRMDDRGDALWTRRWGGPLGLNDDTAGLVVDPDDNVYIAGIADEDFWTCDDEEDCPAAAFAFSYSADGDLRWQTFEGVGYSAATAIEWSPDGVTIAGFVEPERRRFAYFAARLDADTGDVVWTARHRPAGRDDRPQALTLTADDTIVVAGDEVTAFSVDRNSPSWVEPSPFAGRTVSVTTSTDGQLILLAADDSADGISHDFGVAAFDDSGAPLWQDTYDAEHEDWPTVVVAAADGGAVVIGSSEGEYPRTDRVAIAYDRLGTRSWVRRGGSDIAARGSTAERIVVDDDGGVWAAGVLADDVAMVRYTSDGTTLWTHRPPPAEFPNGVPTGIALHDGRAFVTAGVTRRVERDAESTSMDVETIALGPDGTLAWTRRLHRGRVDRGNAIAVAADGAVWVTGYSQRPGRPWDAQLVVIGYAPDGVERHLIAFGGTEGDYGQDVAVHPLGGVVVCGTSGPAIDVGLTTLRVSAEGELLWDRLFDGPDRERAVRIRSGRDGGVWVLGQALRGRRGHAFVVRYSDGGTELWRTTWGDEDERIDFARDVVVDERGHAFVAITAPSARTT